MSMLYVFFAFFACVFAQGEHDHQHHEGHMIDVAVYYESLCPDSIKFFTKQLYPSLQKPNISHYVNLTLVPYGKSKTNRENNQITFECHHGEGECRGNKLQACALKHIDNGSNTEGLGYNKITTAFINCLMDQVKRDGNNTEFPAKRCADLNGVTNTISMIEKCQGDPEANTLLAALGDATEALNPKLKSVPTIVFNKQVKEEDSKLANDNFIKALCQYIQGEKPAECTSSSATSLGINTLIVLIAVSCYFF
ncbi:hypothetical protein HHI36_021206 [Cryptolaemus montrouzieri]|uniref:GILT-like protein 1 n=1 Tax=Cryptolaemus montrouzieri TaxID=559131 RepID=A0ABD2MW24_9CUCU